MSATAHGQFASFGVGPSLPVPGAGNNVVIYNLPVLPEEHPMFGTTVGGSFDVFALVSSGTLQVTGYGAEMTIGGSGVWFADPGPVDEDVPPGQLPPSNMAAVQNPGFSQNAGLSHVWGSFNPSEPNFLTVAALHPTLNADTSLTINDGLFSASFVVDPGVTGQFSVTFGLDPAINGFANNAGTILTNPLFLPHVPGTIEVRMSVLGDMNGDGAVNTLDIENFVNAILDMSALQASLPWLQFSYVGDMNADGNVNTLDIEPFVTLLVGGGTPTATAVAVPEPGGLVLLLTGCAFGLAASRQRRKRAELNS